MEKNAIFNIKRFSALFSTGIYRIKVTQQSILGGGLAFASLLILVTFLLQDVDKDNLRSFLIGLYQLSYMATLTFATFRHLFNHEKQMIWYMLPASAFEKRLFQTLRVLVWNSILFIAIYFCLDHILWCSIYHKIDIDNYFVGLKDLFSFGPAINGLPAWLNYTISILFMVLFPFISSATLSPTSMNSGNKGYKAWWALYAIMMIFQFPFLLRTGNVQVGSIFKIIMACISLLGILIDLTIAAIVSNTSTTQNND